ncbi:MAG: protein TolR [Hyphomonadaceae bacterium]
MAMGLASARRGRSRSRRRGRLSEINVTPFVDVMLVLLIVFMVTAPLLTVGVPVELPRTNAKQLPPETQPLTVTVQQDGSIYLQDTRVARGDILNQLRAISREGYDRRIFIRADSNVSYGHVADVMAILSAAGFRNLGLVTDPTRNTPAPALPDAAPDMP